MKEWVSPVYAFFEPKPHIIEHDGHCDAWSMGNMQKHVRSCWGDEILQAVDQAKDVVGGILQNGSITALFKQKGKGKVTYSHCQHTRTETKAEVVYWVAERLYPFEIIKDRGFQSLMKTGRPQYYLPLPVTMSHNVWLVFARTRQLIADMTKAWSSINEHKGKINFTTDGWTSANH
ncbi:hypothetical protein BDR05DRAFT_978537 [Suillus weaverae]|nr:hypothetical protein BDR05DRAFT_978537 [Suillus weaverae]